MVVCILLTTVNLGNILLLPPIHATIIFREGEEMVKKVLALAFTALLIFSCLIFACNTPQPTSTPTAAPAAPPTPAGPQAGGILRIADLSEGAAIGYIPKQTPSWSWKQVAPAVEKLFRTDKTGNIAPWLAAGYTTDANAKTITVNLRKGVMFHDGTPCDAAAVKWNLDICTAGKIQGTNSFQSVDVVDDVTVRINLKSWDSTIVSNLAWTLGQITSPDAVKKNGEDWAANNPIGTGPFKFVSWQKGVKTVYTKNPDYWQKGKPYLDGIEYSVIADDITRGMALKGKEIDAGQTMPVNKELADLQKAGYIILRGARPSGEMGLCPNSTDDNSPFKDIKVRQAVAYAIDSKGIVSALLGEATAANQHVGAGKWGFNPNVVGYPYDPAKAKQLLTEAGFANGFKTKIIYQTNPIWQLIYEGAQGYLKAVGIDAQIEAVTPQKSSQMLGEARANAMGWDGLFFTMVNANPDMVGVIQQQFSGNGYTRMALPDDLQQAYKNALMAPDFATKQKWEQEWQKLLVDKYCLVIPIVIPNDLVITQPYVHNLGFYGTANPTEWTPEDTWMDKH
jgi:peptide/nickel transport system substrate-binding protein